MFRTRSLRISAARSFAARRRAPAAPIRIPYGSLNRAITTYLQVLDSERNVYGAELTLARARLNELTRSCGCTWLWAAVGSNNIMQPAGGPAVTRITQYRPDPEEAARRCA